MDKNNTIMYNADQIVPKTTKQILLEVYRALEERGYNPIDQMVGYFLSGDPSYITSHNNARNIISRLDRDDILDEMLREYLDK